MYFVLPFWFLAILVLPPFNLFHKSRPIILNFALNFLFFRISYSCLVIEPDKSLTPDDDIKERRKLEKIFREIQRRVHSPESTSKPGFLSPNEQHIHAEASRILSRSDINGHCDYTCHRYDQEARRSGSGHSIYYALPIKSESSTSRNRSVSISPMLYSDITCYLEGRALSNNRRASFASPIRGK